MQEKNKDEPNGAKAIVNEEIQQLQQQLLLIREEYANLLAVCESLEKISGMKKGDEMLVSIGKGVYVQAAINDNSHVLIDVGSGTVLKKKIADAKNGMNKEKTDMKNYSDEFEKELGNLILSAKSSNARK